MTLRQAQGAPMPAAPARFDRTSQHRRAMMAKIAIARKTLAMDEDDYRQILFDETSHNSARDCTDAELEKVIAKLKTLGFTPVPKNPRKGVAQHPVAKKARALWISLYHLGVVHNPKDPALEAFACKQLKCEKFVWARQSDGHKLIEALKSMAERAGWRQSDFNGKALEPRTLQSSLCHVIVARLKDAGAIPDNWQLHDAMWKLCGIENAHDRGWSAEDYARCAQALGRKLREAKGTVV